MTKVAFVTNLCPSFRVKAFEALAKRHDVEYYFFSDGAEDYWDSRNKLFLGNFKGEYVKGYTVLPKIKVSFALIKKILWGDFDVFIKCINGRFALPVTFLIAKLRRKPFVLWQTIWSHPETPFHRMSFLLLKCIWRFTDAFVVYGQHGKDYLVSQGIDPNKIFIAWNTIDNTLFNQPVSEEELDRIRDKYHIGHKKVVLFIGRLEVGKGLDYLLEAFEHMNDGSFVLMIIGEGSQKSRLREHIASRQLRNIFLLDYLKENNTLFHYYALADIFVLPSITTKMFKEPWGMVINEAMNQGCPIVSTNAVGAAVGGLVQDGINGYVVKEKDSAALSAAIKKLLTDDKLRQQMSDQSREIIKQWTYERMSQGFSDAVDYVDRAETKGKSTKNNYENIIVP